MDKLKAFLTRQAGPLPLWAWGLVLAVGLGIAVYIRRAAPAPTETGLEVDTGSPGDVGRGPGTPGFIPVQPSPGDDSGIVTNEQWRVKAITYLVAKGISAVSASNAVSRYLNQEKLSAEDVSLINDVVKGIGPPPTPPDTVPIETPKDQYSVIRYTGPAVRKDVPEWRDGYAKASKDYSWDAYLTSHYTNVAPAKTVAGGVDVRRTVQVSWLRSVNKFRTSVKKGQTVRIPKYVFVSVPPRG